MKASPANLTVKVAGLKTIKLPSIGSGITVQEVGNIGSKTMLVTGGRGAGDFGIRKSSTDGGKGRITGVGSGNG